MKVRPVAMRLRRVAHRSTVKHFLCLITVIALSSVSHADYTEVMNPHSESRNLRSDYGLVDDQGATNQSAVFQQAIDDLAADGGGRIIVPRGTYQLSGVRLKSNIHLLIESGTVIKPFWPGGKKQTVFILDAELPRKKKASLAEQQAFIENVSIRGLGGRFVVDYSDRPVEQGHSAVACRMVRNFLIADLDVQDNATPHCGIYLVPANSTAKDVKDWPVSRATDGTIRNCRIFNASPGYGLVQLHGARSVHFENIYAKGGVALRLETGAVGPQTGVYDITAKNVVCEDGRCAVMFGPHSAVNGVVKVDGVVSKGCAYAVTIGLGGVKEKQLQIQPDAANGSFAEGTYVKDIRAIFGRHAQIKTHAILEIPEEYYDELKLKWFGKFFEGPSIGAVKDATEGAYKVLIENVTMEGFKYNAEKPILTEKDKRPGKWAAELRRWKENHQ